ncbi:MAG TPA: XrtB/PEP-CTERM-associated polysaccharide biosynthesis outer membrane protein EpsL [Burkholderiales bacterium]|nr:XrtB/PEP-CTERM-associated polysaccharide biosynthesis outer membrane protein EpsL [Burkholderiales bacterium]
MAWGESLPEGRGAAVLAACALLLPAVALGQAASPVSPFVEEKIVHDDNVFRLSRDTDPTPLLGTAARSDTYRITSAGLNLDLPVSRQRFVANLSAIDSRYDRFSQLDYTGHDLRATWLWQAENNASGQLGYVNSAALASFANIAGTAPDILKTQQAFFNGTYLASPRWRIHAGADDYQQRNGNPAQQVNDVDIVDGEVGLSYLTPKESSLGESSLGFSVRGESGRFPVQQPVGAILVDNAYRQYRAGFVADWPVTAASHLSGRIDHVNRSYDQVPQRDFNGTTARLQYDWKPTAKIGLTALAQRDLSPFEYVRSSFVLVKGITLRPTYSVTSKIDLSGSFDRVTREYLGDPSAALGVTPSRIDKVHSLGALLTYRALQTVTLQLSAVHETRSSNIAFGDYAANVVFLSGRLAF